MIKLHRLNGQEIILNSDLIESIDSVPDTVINFTNGHTYIVKESADMVRELVIEFKRQIFSPCADSLKK